MTVDNPYWDEVKGHVGDDRWSGGPTIHYLPSGPGGPFVDRSDYVGRYAWTITDPATVAFVAEHANGRLLDPLAGTGYWGWLLAQYGADVLSFDALPPAAGENHWHKSGAEHVPVQRGDGAEMAAAHGANRALLLSWPPYDSPDGADVLRAYTGDRVIYIGEGDGGCTGDDRFHEMLRKEWTEVAGHRPVQFMGIHDYVTVYDRR